MPGSAITNRSPLTSRIRYCWNPDPPPGYGRSMLPGCVVLHMSGSDPPQSLSVVVTSISVPLNPEMVAAVVELTVTPGNLEIASAKSSTVGPISMKSRCSQGSANRSSNREVGNRRLFSIDGPDHRRNRVAFPPVRDGDRDAEWIEVRNLVRARRKPASADLERWDGGRSRIRNEQARSADIRGDEIVVAEQRGEDHGGRRERDLGVGIHQGEPPRSPPADDGGRLARGSGLETGGIGDPVRSRRGTEVHPRVEELIEVAVVHAGHSRAAGRASASRAARMAPRAPWSRDRTVPTGMPSTSAISSCVSSR